MNTIRTLFPIFSLTNKYDTVVELMLDNIVDRINNRIGVDISGGVNNPIIYRRTQIRNPIEVLRLPLPADTNQPYALVEGPIRFAVTNLVLESSVMRKGSGGWPSISFDYNIPYTSHFISPLEATYYVKQSVFGVISDAILKLLRLQMDAYHIGQPSGTTTLARITQITDRDHSITYTGEKEADLNDLEKKILADLQLELQGYKIA